jgi:hypothetical protein
MSSPFPDDLEKPIPPPPDFNPFSLLLAIHQKDYQRVKRLISKIDVNCCLSSENPNIFHYLLDRLMLDSGLDSLSIHDLRLILLLLSVGADPEQKNSNGETARDRLLKFGYKIDRKYLVRHCPYKPPPILSSPVLQTYYAEEIEADLLCQQLPSANRDFRETKVSIPKLVLPPVATSNIYKPLQFELNDDDLYN